LAQDLHDGITQTLYIVTPGLDISRQELDTGSVALPVSLEQAIVTFTVR